MSIKDVFKINEGLNDEIRNKIVSVANELKLELEFITKKEPQIKQMSDRMLQAVDDIVLECGLQGNKFKMRKRYEELLNDASTLRKAAGFTLLTKPGGKPLPNMHVGPNNSGDKVKVPDEKNIVYFLSLVKELSDLVQEAFGVKKLSTMKK